MKRTITATVGLLQALSILAQAPESKTTFSLAEAKEYASENSYFTRKAMMDIEKADQRVKEVTGMGLPQITATAGLNHFIDIPTQIAPSSAFDPTAPKDMYVPLQFGTKNNIKAGVSVNQLIFDGSYIVGLKASRTYRELALSDKAKTDVQIKRDVTKAYGTVLVVRENLRLLKQNEEKLIQIDKENQAVLDAGFIEETDRDQIRILLLNTQNLILETTKMESTVLDMLKFTMGIPIKNEILLTDDIKSLQTPALDANANLEQGLKLKNHVDYCMAEVNLRSNELLLSNERSGFYPRLYGFLNLEQNSFSNEWRHFNPKGVDGKWFPTSIVGLQLNVPIFSGGSRFMKTQQAKIGVEQAELLKEQTEQSLQLEASNKKNSYLSAVNKLKNAEENLNLSGKIKDKTRIKFKEGVAPSLELTQTEAQYLNSQAGYIGALLDVITAKADLDYATANY